MSNNPKTKTNSVFDIQWQHAIGHHFLFAPQQVGNLLIVASYRPGPNAAKAILNKFDLNSGARLAQEKLGHNSLLGLIANTQTGNTDPAFFTTSSTSIVQEPTANIFALDNNGTVNWHYQDNATQFSIPQIAASTLCFTSSAKRFYFLDTQSGDLLGSANLPVQPAMSAPLWSREFFYIPCRGPHLLAVDWQTQIKWHFTCNGRAWLDKTPCISDDYIFTVRSNGAVLALALEDGELQWQVKIGSGKRLSPPATDGKRVYVGAADGLYALDIETGKDVWYFASRRINGSPIIHNNIIYVVCDDRHLYLLDVATGLELGKFQTPDRVNVEPLVLHANNQAKTTIILADSSGNITSLQHGRIPAKHASPQQELTAKTLLIRKLNKHFSVAELKEIAHGLGVDPEELPTTPKSELVFEMVLYFERRNSLSELTKACQLKRPNIPW